MKQLIAKSRKGAIEFAEGGNGHSQRAAYWKHGNIINRAEVIPGQKTARITENVGGLWWSATQTIADKFGINPVSSAGRRKHHGKNKTYL